LNDNVALTEVKAGIPIDARDVPVEKIEYPAPAMIADGDLGRKTLEEQDYLVTILRSWLEMSSTS